MIKNISTLLVFIASVISFDMFAQTTAGKALIAKGNVTAIQADSASQNARKIKRRSLVYSDEVVTTGEKSKAQLRMTDGGMIALKENSELIISEYRFSDDTGKGSVALELLKGGLRSVTGSIKAENGDYNLKTPVGSIGIRGTHFEIELINGQVFLAVWDGAIDLTLGEEQEPISFGDGEDFSFGVINEEGEVTQLLEAPENFNEGHSSDTGSTDTNEDTEETTEETTTEDEGQVVNNTEENEEESTPTEEQEVVETSEQGGVEQQIASDIEEGELFLATEDFDTIASVSLEELIAERTGTFSYGSIEESQLSSTMGAVRNFDFNMEIDFDNGTVPAGNMTFDDDGGEWFVTFGGVISTENINLDVSFASHGDNLADGEIDAAFFDGLDSILGNFDLHEIENPDVRVIGSYRIK